jgi:hypothetical protein
MTTCLSLLAGTTVRRSSPPPPARDVFDVLAQGTTVPGEIAARARLHHGLFQAASGENDEQSAVFHATLLAGDKPRLEWATQWARSFLPPLAGNINVSWLQQHLIVWYGRSLELDVAETQRVLDYYERMSHGRTSGTLTAITAACFYRATPAPPTSLVRDRDGGIHPFASPRLTSRFNDRSLATHFGIEYASEFCLALKQLPPSDTSTPLFQYVF